MLGSEGVNIANMSVSRNDRGDEAVMILSVDTSVEPHVVDRLRTVDGMHSVRLVSLGS